MRLGIACSIRVATLALVAEMGGMTLGWAQCPASPSYSPDFTANQSCLKFNGVTGSPSFVPPQTPQPNVAHVLRLTENQGGWATSAWYVTPQVVTNGFSTTFSFQLGNKTSDVNADGIAFVIQNTDLNALGPAGCSIGFGGCAGGGGGIPKSVAIEFNTFDNGPAVDPNANDVAIQSCGTSPNVVDVSSNCSIAHNPLTGLSKEINLADGSVHVATVTYAPTGASNCGTGGNSTCYTLDVILDGVDLFPNGLPFDITTIGVTSTAYIGFTAATGGDNDEQDITSWTFNPQGQSGSGTVNTGQTTTYDFNGGFNEQNPAGYNFSATPSSQPNPNLQMVVTAIPISQQACNALTGNFAPARCFTYQNGGGQGTDAAVLFEVTCPPNGSCGSNASQASQLNAELATQFSFNCSENVALLCPADITATSGGSFGLPNLSSVTGLPEVGLLKGEGPDPLHPCTPSTNPNVPLFQSNQIDTFKLGDTSGGAKGGSGGTTSCWVVTYQTPGELPTVSITQPANGAYYTQGSQTSANYSCNAINAGVSSPVGPYLSVSTCTAADTPGTAVANGAQFDTATLGPHTFTVQVQDSALNTNQQSVNYNVVTGAVPASGTKCNGVYYGTFKGNITVVKGQSCTFIAGGVTGSIAELGGNLSLSHATVGGGIGIAGGTYFIGPSTIIMHDLLVAATPASPTQSQVCGASIGGGLSFLLNNSPVAIGSGSPACPGNTIAGSLVVNANAAATAIYNNTVGGSLLDQGNSKPTQVFSNRITGVLSCQADSSITGGGNTAAKKQGQCASF